MKITTLAFTASLAATLSFAPAWAEDAGTSQATQTATTAAKPADQGDEIVCKTEPPRTGSMIGGRRVCATRRQWDEQAHNSAEAIARGQAHSRVTSSH